MVEITKREMDFITEALYLLKEKTLNEIINDVPLRQFKYDELVILIEKLKNKSTL